MSLPAAVVPKSSSSSAVIDLVRGGVFRHGKKAVNGTGSSNVSIHSLMTTRRVVLGAASVKDNDDDGGGKRVSHHNPYLSADEMHALSSRLEVLGTNGGLSSVMIATDKRDRHNLGDDGILSSTRAVLPSVKDYALVDRPNPYVIPPDFYGYDPLELDADDTDTSSVSDAFAGLSALTTATNTMEKAPVVTVLRGLVRDGGYAIAMGRYVSVTPRARYVISGPDRGLALDPCGLSYVLPRLGGDYDQEASKYPVGRLMALCGYTATPEDMISTGLATHYLTEEDDVETLERSLAELPTYDDSVDVNRSMAAAGEFGIEAVDTENRLHDAAVANAIDSCSTGNVFADDMLSASVVPPKERRAIEPVDFGGGGMVGLEDFGEARGSPLVNLAATFREVFDGEDTVEGVLDGLKTASSDGDADEEYRAAAGGLLRNMRRRSPLALLATDRLLELGGGKKKDGGGGGGVKLDECMGKERRVQAKLVRMHDFQSWVKVARGAKAKNKGANDWDEGLEVQWKHGSVGEVTRDELEELFSDD